MILSNEHTFNTLPIFRRSKQDNLTPGERRALFDLKQNYQIVIKSADKENAICILQCEDYIAEGILQLS